MPQLKVQNQYRTTITTVGGIVSTGDTSFTVAVAPTYTNGFIIISPDIASQREIVYYHTVSGNTISVRAENRGLGGTTAKTHAQNEVVQMNDVAEIFNTFSDMISQTFFVEKTGGLTVKVWGGYVSYNNAPQLAADTNLTLANNTTNYIKYDFATNTISSDTVNSGNIKAVVVTLSSIITSITIRSTKESYLDPAMDNAFVHIAGSETITGLKTFLSGMFALRNVANTFSGLFTNTNTADRTYSLQNRNGTLADDTDLATKAALAGSVSQAFSVSQLELGNATDTTISRVSAGTIAVEGITISSTLYPTADTDGATVTFNLSANNKHTVTIAGNRTLALSNTTNVPVFSINIKQDATGSRTVTWFSGITWAGGTVPTLTTTANKTDSFGFQQISAGVYLGCVIFQNA